MQVPVWEYCLRIITLYVMVAVGLRIMGKREIGQLSVFDFVISVMIAELSALPMEDPKLPMVQTLFAIGALVALQVLVAFIQMKSHRFRHFIDGEPTVLIEHGQIQDKEMHKIRYTVSDLMMQLRDKGFPNVADVEFAILETSGQLSVVPKAEKRPLTPSDLGLRVHKETIHMPIVSDGQIVQKTLAVLRKDEEWLQHELQRRGYNGIHDVFYAEVDDSGAMFIDGRDEDRT